MHVYLYCILNKKINFYIYIYIYVCVCVVLVAMNFLFKFIIYPYIHLFKFSISSILCTASFFHDFHIVYRFHPIYYRLYQAFFFFFLKCWINIFYCKKDLGPDQSLYKAGPDRFQKAKRWAAELSSISSNKTERYIN